MTAFDMWDEMAEAESEGRITRRLANPDPVVQSSVLTELVANFMDVDVADMMGRSQRKSVATARHVLAWALRQQGKSYPEIGAALGRDHTTILSALRSIERRRASDPELARTLDELAETIRRKGIEA